MIPMTTRVATPGRPVNAVAPRAIDVLLPGIGGRRPMTMSAQRLATDVPAHRADAPIETTTEALTAVPVAAVDHVIRDVATGDDARRAGSA